MRIRTPEWSFPSLLKFWSISLIDKIFSWSWDIQPSTVKGNGRFGAPWYSTTRRRSSHRAISKGHGRWWRGNGDTSRRDRLSQWVCGSVNSGLLWDQEKRTVGWCEGDSTTVVKRVENTHTPSWVHTDGGWRHECHVNTPKSGHTEEYTWWLYMTRNFPKTRELVRSVDVCLRKKRGTYTSNKYTTPNLFLSL